MLKDFIRKINHISLITQILIAMAAGLALAILSPSLAQQVAFLGELFISALKAIAPILVFILVTTAISNYNNEHPSHIKPVLWLYGLGTFGAALVAVAASMLFPTELVLSNVDQTNFSAPETVSSVIHNLLFSIVDNPINALVNANFMSVLAWAVGFGIALRQASDSTQAILNDLSDAVSWIIKKIIQLTPLGVFGLVAGTVADAGLMVLLGYAHLLAVLLGSMLVVALVINPLLVWWKLRRNPFPLVFLCLRESGITAFFTRSSAANIPVNMALAERLKLDHATYAVTIPLGATINMAGAAVSISVLTLATVYSLGIEVDFVTALLLSLLASISACGVSGVAGGSLLLVPLACSLFGIDAEVSMQVVAIGFVIGVLQDSTETALNSSTDVLFTAAACLSKRED